MKEDGAINEAKCIQQVKQGSERAFEHLVRRYTPMVFGLLMELVANPEDAKDLTQEAFIKAYRNMKWFRETARFSTWLYRIAYNTGIDFQRSKKAKRHVPLEAVNEAAFSLEPSVYSGRSEVIEKGLDALSPSQRVAVVMHYNQGLKLKEVAEILECAEATARVHLFRGLKRLREVLPQDL